VVAAADRVGDVDHRLAGAQLFGLVKALVLFAGQGAEGIDTPAGGEGQPDVGTGEGGSAEGGERARVIVSNPPYIAYEEAALPRLVGDELRSVTADLMDGKAIERTRVRSLANLVRTEEVYRVSQVIAKLDEACAVTGDEHWFKLYEANQEKIRNVFDSLLMGVEALRPLPAAATR
jgi:hypothetical protein